MARPRTGDEARDNGRAPRIARRTLLKGAAVGAGALLLTPEVRASTGTDHASALAPLHVPVRAATAVGPSSSAPSYVLPSLPAGVEITAILTVGDAADNGYRMVGIPDGLGALRTGQTFTLLVNHEIRLGGGAAGLVRAHGSNGAFVSKWVVDRETLRVLSGADLTPTPNHVHLWNPATGQYSPGTVGWDRLCSADLPAEAALLNGNRGSSERIFFNGDEIPFGRAWARVVTGPQAGHVWELPRLGKMAFENVVACPYAQDRTIVALFDDGALDTAPDAAQNPSEVFVYVGTKEATGNEIERAGLTNGRLYGVRVYRDNVLVTEESDEFGFGDPATGYVDRARFDLVELGAAGDVSAMSGVEMEQDAIDKNVFRFQRPDSSVPRTAPGTHGRAETTPYTSSPPRASARS
jgi:hypothetical protein